MRKNLLKVLISSALCMSIIVSTAVSAVAATHTTEDIINKMVELPFKKNIQVEYNEAPSAVNPYKIGEVSELDLEKGLNSLNLIRYIAGLNSVTLDDNYNKIAQHTAVLMAANTKIDHDAPKPSDMSDEFYGIAADGAKKTNLYQSSSLNNNIVNSMMAYANDANVISLGHRRWILSPDMGKTGFGAADNEKFFSAMYVQDESGDSNVDYVSWPSENMPYSLYEEILNSSSIPKFVFSLSFGNLDQDEYDDVDINKVNVKVTKVINGVPSESDVQNLNASNCVTDIKSQGNYLYVDNNLNYTENGIHYYEKSYGMNHCVMFEFGQCDKNSIYDIEISGITKNGVESPINYTVSLFDDQSVISDASAQVLSNYKTTQTTTMRVLASIHSLNLDEVGFVFSTKNENPTVNGTDCEQRSTTKVYTSIRAAGDPVTAYDLSGTYIATAKITGIPAANYDTPIYVRTYAKTGSSNEYVYGTTQKFVVNSVK